MLMMKLVCRVKRDDGEYECNTDGSSIATVLTGFVPSHRDPRRFGHVGPVNETRYDCATTS